MRRALLLMIAIASASASAEEGPSRAEPSVVEKVGGRFELGVGVGYAYGLGHETGSALMGDLTFGTLPLLIDAGYNLSDHFALGAYAGYGPMFARACPDTVSCSGSSLRLGVRARYRFSESGNLVPWFALGAGYERLSQSDSYQGTTVDSGASGFELLRLELGAEHRVSSLFALGPFLSGSLAEFLTRDLAGSSNRIEDRALHFWVMAGLRGSFWL